MKKKGGLYHSLSVAVVFFSQTGMTEKLAQEISKSVKKVGLPVFKYAINASDIKSGRFINESVLDKLSSCDAIVIGSPTYMGGVAAQFKVFADATSELWTSQLWSGKLAAGFTCGGSLNGDQTVTLQYLVTLASQHGMLWLGLDAAHNYKDHGINRLGCQLGVVAHRQGNEVNNQDLLTAEYLGRRIAQQLLRLY